MAPTNPAGARASWSGVERALLAGLLLVAGGLALDHALDRFGSWEALPERFRGSRSYSHIGTAWAEGESLGNGRPPLYPLVLGLLARLAGDPGYAHAAVLLQGALLVASVGAVFLLGRRAGGAAGWGLAAGLLVACNGLWLHEMLAKRETLYYGLALLGLYARVDARAWRSASGAAGLGALCAAGWLTRPTGVLLAPVVALTWWLDARREGRAPRAAARTAAFVAGLALPVALWVGYQVHHGMDPVVSDASAASNLYKGQHPALPAIYPYTDVDHLAPHIDARVADWRQRGLDAGDEMQREALRHVREHPGEVLAMLPRKAAAFLVPIHFPLGRGRPERDADGSWRLADYRPAPWSRHRHGLAALPGVVALFWALARFRRLAPAPRFAVLVVGLTLGIHLATFAQTRFRLPFDPPLAVVFVALLSGGASAGASSRGARDARGGKAHDCVTSGRIVTPERDRGRRGRALLRWRDRPC